MPMTEETALRAYAKMMNTQNLDCLEPLLADDFTYESSWVWSAIESKQEFLDYIRQKLETIQQADAPVFAEIGTLSYFGQHGPCVILAQNHKDNLVCLVFAKTDGEKIKRLDLCIVPPTEYAERSGEYPK